MKLLKENILPTQWNTERTVQACKRNVILLKKTFKDVRITFNPANTTFFPSSKVSISAFTELDKLFAKRDVASVRLNANMLSIQNPCYIQVITDKTAKESYIAQISNDTETIKNLQIIFDYLFSKNFDVVLKEKGYIPADNSRMNDVLKQCYDEHLAIFLKPIKVYPIIDIKDGQVVHGEITTINFLQIAKSNLIGGAGSATSESENVYSSEINSAIRDYVNNEPSKEIDVNSTYYYAQTGGKKVLEFLKERLNHDKDKMKLYRSVRIGSDQYNVNATLKQLIAICNDKYTENTFTRDKINPADLIVYYDDLNLLNAKIRQYLSNKPNDLKRVEFFQSLQDENLVFMVSLKKHEQQRETKLITPKPVSKIVIDGEKFKGQYHQFLQCKYPMHLTNKPNGFFASRDVKLPIVLFVDDEPYQSIELQFRNKSGGGENYFKNFTMNIMSVKYLQDNATQGALDGSNKPRLLYKFSDNELIAKQQELADETYQSMKRILHASNANDLNKKLMIANPETMKTLLLDKRTIGLRMTLIQWKYNQLGKLNKRYLSSRVHAENEFKKLYSDIGHAINDLYYLITNTVLSGKVTTGIVLNLCDMGLNKNLQAFFYETILENPNSKETLKLKEILMQEINQARSTIDSVSVPHLKLV